MNKKTIILLLIVVALGVGVYFLLAGRPESGKVEQEAEQMPPETTGPSAGTTAPQQPASSGLVAVDIKGFAFVGETTAISAGTKITWKNYDAAPHTVTSDTGLFDSKTLLKGQSFSYTFTQPGSYKYHCAIHPYIVGEIFVK